MQKDRIFGYLPNDVPPFGQAILLGFQHILTMFPATVLVALLVGFDVSVVLTASGLATVVALLGSYFGAGRFIPLYYGSSFSYIAATWAITGAQFGQGASVELVRVAQAGIVATGVFNIIVGLLIRAAGGKKTLDKVLPPVVTGSVAMVIGIALGKSALDMAGGTCCLEGGASSLSWWFVAGATLFSTIIFSVYLQGRGFIGMLPVLLGAIFGYLVSIPFGMPNWQAVVQSPWVAAPRFTLPDFTHNLSATAILGIGVIAIATIPESTAHLYQIGLYVDHLAAEMKREKYRLSELIGLNLVLDGIGDCINGLLGGVAGTNYGENNSLMVITRNYSGPALIAAGVIAILLGFIGKLAGLVHSVPTAVSGGLAIYLFGVIGLQGVALMMSEKVNLFNPKELAIGATILIVGIGGAAFEGGFIPIRIPGFSGYEGTIFPQGLPSIATAAVAGIVLNLTFLIFPAEERKLVEALPDAGRE